MQTYTVKAGDTLYGISNQFGVSAKELADLNNVNANTLKIGQILKIPTIQGTNPTNMFIYTVKKGDSLYSIAKKYNMTVKDIIALNGGEGVEVARLTTQGASYTIQNDGYITGTVQASGGGAFVYFNGTDVSNIVYYTNYSDTKVYNASIFASKGTVVSTRSNYGNYNLTVYEWK